MKGYIRIASALVSNVIGFLTFFGIARFHAPEWRWVAEEFPTPKGNPTCFECMRMDGNTRSIIGHFGGPVWHDPPAHPHCRCRLDLDIRRLPGI